MSISFWPTIQQMTAGPVGSPGVIARDSQWTIVIADTSQNGGATDVYCELPSGADIGDAVEVYRVNNGGNSPIVVAPSGEQLSGITPSSQNFYRKIDSVTWGRM